MLRDVIPLSDVMTTGRTTGRTDRRRTRTTGQTGGQKTTTTMATGRTLDDDDGPDGCTEDADGDGMDTTRRTDDIYIYI